MNAAKKRVLFIDHTASLGGGEIALLNLVANMRDTLYHPVVVLFSRGPLEQRLADAGVDTHVMPLAGSVVNVRKDTLGLSTLIRLPDAFRMAAFIWRLRRFIRESNIDIVHTNSLKADILGGLAAKLARVPLIWHIRDRIEADYLPRKVVFIFRWLCRRLPDFVVANSAATLGTAHLDRAERGAAIPSGIDLRARVVHDGMNASDPDDLQDVEQKRTRLIGLVGRISRWKGQHVFLEAAALVRERFSNVKFQIIGAPLFDEREYEQEVHRLVGALVLEDCVEFTGFREDVSALVNQLEILVHASITAEPFGQVVTEGMAACKPVVATAGGGVLEIVIDGVTGLLVPMGDAVAMANAICQLLEDPQAARRMGQAGRQRVQEQFAIEQTVAKVECVYDEVLMVRRMMARENESLAGFGRSRIVGAAASLSMVGAAFAIAETLRHYWGERAPLSGLFLVAVMLSARIFGERDGLLATVTSLFAAAYILPPEHSLQIERAYLPVLIVFAIVGLTITWLIGNLRKAEARARTAQAAAESARSDSDFIVRAAAAFSVCSDQRGVARAVAQMAIARLCDCCVIDLIEVDRSLARVHAVHRDPGKQDLTRQLCALGPPLAGDDSVVKAIRCQKIVRFDPTMRHDAAADSTRVEINLGLGLKHGTVIPLSSAGRVVGAISLLRTDDTRPYRAADLNLAGEFAWRAGMALASVARQSTPIATVFVEDIEPRKVGESNAAAIIVADH